MRLALALYLLTVSASLALPVVHERCHIACEAAREAAQADIGSNYKHEHKGAGVSAAQQIKRDRERLALLITEQAITREIARMKGLK
jgi:hypothetical protein